MVAKRPKFCGWGYEGEGLTPDEHEMVLERYAERFGLEGFARNRNWKTLIFMAPALKFRQNWRISVPARILTV